MALKRAVPLANIKQYGGLRRFIEQFCGGNLQWIRKHGLDDVYATTKAAASPQETQVTSAFGAWHALTNPTSAFSAFVSPTDGTLRVLPNQETSPAGLVRVPKITTEEHRGIARAFLPKLAQTDRPAFEETLNSENYWQQWVRQTNTFDNGKYRGEWLAFRQTQVLDLVKTKLASVDVKGSVAESVLQTARDSKAPVPLNARTPALIRHIDRPRELVPANRRLRENDLKRLAHQAIDMMGEDEVRKLRLPLGAVIDALRTRQS